MSYFNLPKQFPGMYIFDEETKLWVPKKAKGKKHPFCQVAFCTRPSEKAAQTGRSLMCGTCRVRLWRANNPIRAIYNAVKNKARRRRIPFDLDYEIFERLCRETEYHARRGRAVTHLHIDRIDALRGYHNDNVQILTAAENREKLNHEETRSRYEWEEYCEPDEDREEELDEAGDGGDPF
jgi:hypothetical protein